MYMHINKTGNNETIIKIINTYALTGDDTGLNTGDDAVQNLDVGGNKDPLTKDLAALYDDAAHQKNPLSDTLRARRERGLKLFHYLTPKLKFCQRPKPKIAPSRSIPAICAPFPAVCTKPARQRGTTGLIGTSKMEKGGGAHAQIRGFAALGGAAADRLRRIYGAAAGRTPDNLIMQLAEGEGPDLLATTGTDFTSFERSLVFVELGPLLDEFADELIPGVYEALNGQRSVYGLPTGFTVSTFLTSPSRIGGQESLTMDEAREYAAALGEGASVFDKWMSRSELFKRVLRYSAGSFIDWEGHSCDFANGEFTALLELCMEQRADDSPVPMENLCLLNSYPLSGRLWFSGNLQELGDYCFVGFPMDEPGAKGWLYTGGTTFLATAEGDTEGAMEFLRFVLSPEAQKLTEDFPLLQSELDRRTDTAIRSGLMTETDAEKLSELLGPGLRSSDVPNEIYFILTEEAQACFAGDCTPAEAAARMQDRVSTYLAEQS